MTSHCDTDLESQINELLDEFPGVDHRLEREWESLNKEEKDCYRQIVQGIYPIADKASISYGGSAAGP